MFPYILIGTLVVLGIILHDFPRYNSRWDWFGVKEDEGALGCLYHDLSNAPIGSHRFPRLWHHWFWIVIASLILMAGCRYRIGMDNAALMDGYMDFPLLKDFTIDSMARNAGGRHVILYSICKSLGMGLWPIQLFCAIVLNVTAGWFIVRFTHNWFLAVALYLCFAYIPLNFETMYQGAAAGCLLMGADDFRHNRWGRFYLKMFFGIMIHLSLIAMIWLPVLKIGRVRKLLQSWKGISLIFIVVVVIAFVGRWLLLTRSAIIDGFPITDLLHINSEGINIYSKEMLSAPPLNYKGIIRYLLLYTLLPIGIWWKLKSHDVRELNDSEDKKMSGREFLGIMVIIFGMFGLMALWMGVFWRLLYYLLIPACVAGASTFGLVKSDIGNGAWWIALIAVVGLQLYPYCGHVAGTSAGRLWEIYVPYAGVFDKGISHHREWLYHNKYRHDRGFIQIEEEKFYYSLDPGTYYIDAPLHDTAGWVDSEIKD